MNRPKGHVLWAWIGRFKRFFYCDRTSKIPLLENAKSQLFIRPRRFGKSLLLSMLENYYDVSKKDQFEDMLPVINKQKGVFLMRTITADYVKK